MGKAALVSQSTGCRCQLVRGRSIFHWDGCRVPTEAEWERAARGLEGRRFPWGNNDVGTWRLNCAGTNIGHPTPVGLFPAGASPEGIMDLAGNVWEWCHDWYQRDYYQRAPVRNPKGPDKGTQRALRGGSWFNDIADVRSSDRDRQDPARRVDIVGFRVCRV